MENISNCVSSVKLLICNGQSKDIFCELVFTLRFVCVIIWLTRSLRALVGGPSGLLDFVLCDEKSHLSTQIECTDCWWLQNFWEKTNFSVNKILEFKVWHWPQSNQSFKYITRRVYLDPGWKVTNVLLKTFISSIMELMSIL